MKKITCGGSATALLQGLHSPVKKGKRFPHKIAVAVTAITNGSIFPNLPKAARSILGFIVSLADCTNPTGASWAFKETIATQLRMSESTVYRGLNELIKSQLIVRLEQERKAHNGRMHVSRIKLTSEACVYLGLINLPEPKFSENLNEDNNDAHNNKNISIELTDESTPACQTYSNGNGIKVVSDALPVTSSKTTETHRPKQGKPFVSLPSELIWLTTEGLLSAKQIFFLMREFSSRKQRLSDAVKCVCQKIKSLPKKAVFAYLRSLAKAPTDFAWITKEKNKEAQILTEEKQAEIVRRRLTEDMVNRYFLEKSGEFLYRIEGSYATTWHIETGSHETCSVINSRFVQDYQNEKFKLIDQQDALNILQLWEEKAKDMEMLKRRITQDKTYRYFINRNGLTLYRVEGAYVIELRNFKGIHQTQRTVDTGFIRAIQNGEFKSIDNQDAQNLLREWNKKDKPLISESTSNQAEIPSKKFGFEDFLTSVKSMRLI